MILSSYSKQCLTCSSPVIELQLTVHGEATVIEDNKYLSDADLFANINSPTIVI